MLLTGGDVVKGGQAGISGISLGAGLLTSPDPAETADREVSSSFVPLPFNSLTFPKVQNWEETCGRPFRRGEETRAEECYRLA